MFSTQNSQACVLPVFMAHQIPPPTFPNGALQLAICAFQQTYHLSSFQAFGHTAIAALSKDTRALLTQRPSAFLPENHKHPSQLSSTAFPVKATHSNRSNSRGLTACRLIFFCLCLLSLHCRHWSPNPPIRLKAASTASKVHLHTHQRMQGARKSSDIPRRHHCPLQTLPSHRQSYCYVATIVAGMTRSGAARQKRGIC